MKASLYSKYLAERTPSFKMLETSKGFAIYTFPDKETVYIQDIYVLPEYRRMNYASKMANTIAFRAKEQGCKYMIGTVLHSAVGAQASKEVLEAYGMVLTFEGPEYSVYVKEIA